MSDGTSQEQRFPAGFAGLDWLTDDRRLEDLLAMGRDYAAQLAFLNDRKQTDDTWAALLDRDESFLLARLLTIRVDAIERDFLDDLDAGRLDRLAFAFHGLENFLHTWLAAISDIGRDGATDILGSDIGRLMVARSKAMTREMQPSMSRKEAPSEREKRLRRQFFALTEHIRRLQDLGRNRFHASLTSGVHEPAAGLLLALNRVHVRLQEQINRFPDRLADFYFRSCLEIGPRAPEPDKVHLAFRRDPAIVGEVIIPRGQIFEAAAPQGGDPVRFIADSQLIVTDARVAALYTLRAERDPKISPECLFGHATRLSLANLGDTIVRPSAAVAETLPVFGGKLSGSTDREIDARIGLAICSPILALSQGERTISVMLELAVADADEIESSLKAAATSEEFAAAFGSFFVNWLLSDEITDVTMTKLVELIRGARADPREPCFLESSLAGLDRLGGEARFADELVALMLGLEQSGTFAGVANDLAGRRRLARNILFPKFFKVELSTPSGWIQLADPLPISSSGPAGGHAAGEPGLARSRGMFGLRLVLHASDPPVAPCTALHGEEWPNDAPVLRLTLSPLSRIFGLSIFEQAKLGAIVIDVEVEGLRDIELHNQLGQVDPSKPFLPFGPLPDPSAYFVIGSPEIAAKNITRCVLHFEWAGLPSQGFADHYRGYPVTFRDDNFTVTPALLRDGTWLPVGDAQPLFLAPVGTAPPRQDITFPPASLIANWRGGPSAGRYGADARNGFLRLQFTAPVEGFGERLYANALADSLRTKPSRDARPPRPPVAPRVTRLTLGYRAKTTIRIGREGLGERVMHLHPLGTKVIHPVPTPNAAPTMLPFLGRDGQLLIGLDGEQVAHELTLLFDLAPDTAIDLGEVDLPKADLAWSWLSEEDWEPLDRWRLTSDTTRGFMRSGIVCLQLPRKLPRRSNVQPGALTWLRVATDAPSNRFAVLRGITSQALTVTRVSPVPDMLLPTGTIDSRSASIPGVLAISQPLPSFDLRPPETLERERTRIGERLRHKDRASSPWDYERLVLEAFPQVHKVKCLPNLIARTDPEDAPSKPLPVRSGKVLVVVVPVHPESTGERNSYDTRPFGIDAWEIEKIRDYLRARCSPVATIDVISASFEQIQVRCHVGLMRNAHAGTVLREVNRAIRSFLSPWTDVGMGTNFDWSIRSEDIYGVVRAAHPHVSAVSGVSLIRVWEDDRIPVGEAGRRVVTYHLDDNGPRVDSNHGLEAESVDGDRSSSEIRASRPWTLQLPFSRHIIQVIGQDSEPSAVQTGIAHDFDILDYTDSAAGLQIGETFIIEP